MHSMCFKIVVTNKDFHQSSITVNYFCLKVTTRWRMHKVELGTKTIWTREASTREEDNGKLDKAAFTTKQILGTHLNFQFAED